MFGTSKLRISVCLIVVFLKIMYTLSRNLILLTLCLVAKPGFALLTPTVDSIPMKDGRKLAADIYIPSGMTQGPVILVQTPYNRQLYRVGGLPLGIGVNVNASNYIFVVVDWRGFYGSRNAGYAGSPDRGTDGYYTVEWLASQSWSNGKIGTWGPSALGKVQFQTAEYNPPHLTCICPLVAGPQFSYAEYFPNGSAKTEYIEQLDGLGFGISPVIMGHPYYDLTWNFTEQLNFYPDSIRVPCFMVGGWYDHNIEVMIPFFSALQSASPLNVRDKHKLLMGPWVHGGHGTAQVGTTVQGELNYPNANNKNDSVALMFFDHYLRNVNNAWDQQAAITYYQMGQNVWQTASSWPPSGTSDVKFYFHNNGGLDNVRPTQASDSLTFSYDPNDPSPTIGGPTLRMDLDQGPYDQRAAVESRNDVLIYTTNTLVKNVVLKGQVKVRLRVSSDKFDTDFTIRLTDVYPDGRSMLVNDGIMRMRFRDGNTQAQVSLMTPGVVYDCEIDLPNTCLTFLAGHKIRIIVGSSNYPRFNRNMNTGGVMYPGNSLDSLVNPVTAKNTVFASSANASYISMPLVGYNNSVSSARMDQNALHLSPNPAASTLVIKSDMRFDEPNIEIFDRLGRKVISPLTTESPDSYTVDISGLLPGIYTVLVKSPSGILSQTFIKL